MDNIYFYNEKEKPYGVFSNFYRHEITPLIYEGKEYNTSEHIFQCLKFDYPGASKDSLEYAEIIRNASTPNKAKILANQKIEGGYKWKTDLNILIKKYLDKGVKIREDWEEIKEQIMEDILLVKFNQDFYCKKVLKSTGNRYLAEHTSRDCYWGDGGGTKKGKNKLGIILMKVRDVLFLEK